MLYANNGGPEMHLFVILPPSRYNTLYDQLTDAERSAPVLRLRQGPVLAKKKNESFIFLNPELDSSPVFFLIFD